MRFWIPFLFVPLLSCGQKEYSQEQCKALEEPKAYVDRCLGGKLTGEYIGDLKCWPFSPPERMRGVWAGGLETSEFYPNATTMAQAKTEKPRIWLQAEVAPPQAKAVKPPIDADTSLVEVEGRLSLCDGWFGHLGQYPRELIVNRFYYVRELPLTQR